MQRARLSSTLGVNLCPVLPAVWRLSGWPVSVLRPGWRLHNSTRYVAFIFMGASHRVSEMENQGQSEHSVRAGRWHAEKVHCGTSGEPLPFLSLNLHVCKVELTTPALTPSWACWQGSAGVCYSPCIFEILNFKVKEEDKKKAPGEWGSWCGMQSLP